VEASIGFYTYDDTMVQRLAAWHPYLVPLPILAATSVIAVLFLIPVLSDQQRFPKQPAIRLVNVVLWGMTGDSTGGRRHEWLSLTLPNTAQMKMSRF